MPKKQRKKLNKKDRKYVVLLILAILAIIYTVVTNNTEEEIEQPNFLINNSTTTTVQEVSKTSSNTSNETATNSSSSSLEIYFFDVGQADSILIRNNNQNMLIDAGNNADGKLIANYLKSDLKISKLNYVVGTHAHEDHIGGLDDVIKNLEIEKVYMPFVSNANTKTYEDVENAIIDKDLSITNPSIGDKFSLGNAELEVMFVDNTEPKEKNDSSIVLQMNYGNEKYLFMGDAETKTEKSRNWEKINVLKVGHHGSNTSSSDKFIKQVLPDISIISVGPNNSYNLPKETIINRLKKYNSTIYRTDTDGTIYLTSDGIQNNISKLNVCLDGDSRN